MAATFAPNGRLPASGGDALDLDRASGTPPRRRRRLQPVPGEGFGLHLVDVWGSRTTGGPDVSEVEAAVAGTHMLHRVRAGVDVVPAIGELDPQVIGSGGTYLDGK